MDSKQIIKRKFILFSILLFFISVMSFQLTCTRHKAGMSVEVTSSCWRVKKINNKMRTCFSGFHVNHFVQNNLFFKWDVLSFLLPESEFYTSWIPCGILKNSRQYLLCIVEVVGKPFHVHIPVLHVGHERGFFWTLRRLAPFERTHRNMHVTAEMVQRQQTCRW